MNSRTPDIITVAVTRVDGGLTILRIITTEYRPTTVEEKEEGLGDRVANWTIDPTPEYIENIIAKYNWPPELKMVTWRIVPNDFVTKDTDKTYRNAWKDDGKKISYDMDKVKDIHMGRLRQERVGIFEEKDNEWMRMLGQNKMEEANQIEAERQMLRDFSATIKADLDLAKTPDDVKKIGLPTKRNK